MSKILTLPNLLSLSRLGLAIAMAWAVYHSHWYVAVTILWTAIFTDVMDGYVARKNNQTSALGGLMDHGSDAFFGMLKVCIIGYFSG